MIKFLCKTIASVCCLTTVLACSPVAVYADWYKNNDGSWNYIDEGAIVNGWKLIQSKWYFFDENGIMKTGWVNYEGNWYYMDQNGVMQTGMISVNEKRYILDSNGKMLMGNVMYGNQSYKLATSGEIISEDTSSVYRKLENGEDIRILIVGDSIGLEASKETDRGGWVCRLQDYLTNKYKCKVSVTNLSVYGTTTKYGYEKLLNSNISNYDLAFICFGINDRNQKMSVEEFESNYKNIIKEIKDKNNNCDIIPIIESAFRQYDDFTNVIMKLSNSNRFSYADTIEAYNKSGIKYSELSNDTVHPNDKGYEIYFKVVSNIIDSKTCSKK